MTTLTIPTPVLLASGAQIEPAWRTLDEIEVEFHRVYAFGQGDWEARIRTWGDVDPDRLPPEWLPEPPDDDEERAYDDACVQAREDAIEEKVNEIMEARR